MSVRTVSKIAQATNNLFFGIPCLNGDACLFILCYSLGNYRINLAHILYGLSTALPACLCFITTVFDGTCCIAQKYCSGLFSSDARRKKTA